MAVLAVTTLAASASAQTGTPAPVVGWQDGFFIQSPDGNNRLLIGLVAQADGRFSIDSERPITNTFALRKLRPTLSGRVARYFDFKIMPDFGNGTTVVADAYFDIRFSPKLRVRSGKDKSPVGYELLLGDAFLLFPERSVATNLVPNRDVGFQIQGDLNPKFYYAGGVFNGVPDGASSLLDADLNHGKDLEGRIVVHPFRSAQAAGRWTGLGVQLGGSTGKQVGALPIFRTSVGQPYFTYIAGAMADGTRARVTPSVFYYYKSFGGFAEWMQSTQDVAQAGVTREFTNRGWNVTGSYLLTGETTSGGIIRPRRPFDPEEGHWGALQIVARYAVVSFDEDIFLSGFAGTNASDSAHQFTVGFNWHPASVFKYYLNYERTEFGETATSARATENVIFFRAQLGI
jgi:phosphate-selective porin OprO/OprP